MASQIDIAALPADGWEGTEFQDNENAFNTAAAGNPELHAVTGYREIDDLVNRIKAILDADPDFPCLRSLEISAHGNPIDCDDYQIAESATWATKLKTLRWCDEGAIYLSSCNTGLALPPPRIVRGPLAEALATAMAVQPGQFENHITVYGTAGYLSGTRTEGNLDTIKSFNQKKGKKKTFWEEYPGAREATGNQVWNAFRNW
jgi:hypothetical protein